MATAQEETAAHPGGGAEPGDGMRRAMRVATVEGVLASASDNFAGPYLSLYALALGATNAQIGMVNALPALLTHVLQLPAAIFADRFRRRKALCIVGGFGMRFSWLPIALIPLALPPAQALLAYIALLTLRSAFAAAAVPAWTSLMADMTPRQMRGAYFSNRNIMCNLAALGATLGSGLILRLFGDPLGYQVTFGVAAAFGAAAAYTFRRFPDPDAGGSSSPPARVAERAPRVRLAARVKALRDAVRREKCFTSYALTSALWNFGVTLPQPLFAVYFVEQLGGSAGFWGVASAGTFVTTILGQRYWGRLSDRMGGRNVLIASGTIAALVPAFWLVAFRPEHALWINLATGLGWAGFNLAAFNLLLEVTPDARRTTYVAGYNGLIGIAHFAGPLLGGAAADLYGVMPVFAVSTLIRLVAWGLFATRVRTSYDQPFVWRELLPLTGAGVGRLGAELISLPRAIRGRVHARRLERRMREKARKRMIERALRGRDTEGE